MATFYYDNELNPNVELISNKNLKKTVKAVAIENVNISTPSVNAWDFDNGLVIGDRVLLRNQTVSSQNGIYIYNGASALVRADDSDASNKFSNNELVSIENGVVFGGCIVAATVPNGFVLGTDTVTYEKWINKKDFILVKCASTTNLITNSLTPVSIVDSLPLLQGTLVLLKDQTVNTENGVWFMTFNEGLKKVPYAIDSVSVINPTSVGINFKKTFNLSKSNNTYHSANDFDICEATMVVEHYVGLDPYVDFVIGAVIQGQTIQADSSIFVINNAIANVYVMGDGGIPFEVKPKIVFVRNNPSTSIRYKNTIWYREQYNTINPVSNGLNWKQYITKNTEIQTVKVVSITNKDVSTELAVGQQIDDISLLVGDQVLLSAQTISSENGVYTVTATAASKNWNQSTTIFVKNGQEYAKTIWNFDGVWEKYPNTSEYTTVKASTISNGTLATAFASGQVLDDITLTVGDLILIKNQSTASENGIYRVTASTPNKIMTQTNIVFVLSGTQNQNSVLFKNGNIWNSSRDKDSEYAEVKYTFNTNQALASSLENGDVVDGVTLVTGDKILLVSQSTASENGVYQVNVAGAPIKDAFQPKIVYVTAGINQNKTYYAFGTSSWQTPNGQIFNADYTSSTNAVVTSLSNGASFNPFTLSTGQYVLLRNQTSVSENGVYLINASGSPTKVTPSPEIVYVSAGFDEQYNTMYKKSGFAYENISAAGSIIRCQAASTTNVTFPSGIAAGQSIDGTVLSAGGYVILTKQSVGSENGIYQVLVTGTPSRLKGVAGGFPISGTQNKFKLFLSTGTLSFSEYTRDFVSVVVATLVNTSVASGLTSGTVIDGVTLATNDKVLLTNQSISSENGIYQVNATGAATKLFTSPMIVYCRLGNSTTNTVWYNSIADQWVSSSDKDGEFITVRLATTSSGVLSTDFENADQIDGVTLATSDLILLKNQSTASENGIYQVNATGAPTKLNYQAKIVFVSSGTSNSSTTWFNNATNSWSQSTLPNQIETAYLASTTIGTYNTSFAAGSTVDGVTISAGNKILLIYQSIAGQNGLHIVNSTGAPTRLPTQPKVIYVTDGQTNLRQTFIEHSTGDWRSMTNMVPRARVATTVAGTLTTDFEAGDVVDGITLATGDTILITNQAVFPENGLYLVNATGAPTLISGFSPFVAVTSGNTNANKLFLRNILTRTWSSVGGSAGMVVDTTPKSTAFTATANTHYMLVPTISFTVTMPTSPVAGTKLKFTDISGSAASNNITLNTTAQLFNGAADNLVLNVNRVSVEIIYTGASYGWVIV